MAEAPRDQNHIPTALFESSTTPGLTISGKIDQTTGRILIDSAAGSGTVTTVSVVSANGFAGSVANATTTPAITISTTVTGILSGNGTAISAASTTGSGSVVLATSPSITTPSIAGSTGTGVNDYGAADSFEIPNSNTPTVNANGEIAVDLSVTDFSHGVVLYFGGEELGIVAMPIAQFTSPQDGYIVTYNATADEFQLTAPAGGGIGGSIAVTQVAYGADTDEIKGEAGFTYIEGTNTLNVPIVTVGSVLASANDSGAIGASGTAFSDLFLASGGVINWAAADATITHSSGLLTFNTPITSAGVVTGTGFAPTATTATGNRMYLPAADTLGFAIGGAGELQLTATALSPMSDDGLALGTTALGWQSLFGDTGFVINIENGNWVATHTSAILTIGTGDLRVTTAGTDTASVVTVGGTQTLTAKTLTAPAINAATLTGNLNYAAVPASDHTANGITVSAFNLGATIALMDLVYLGSSSKWLLTDADAAATAGPVLLGICLDGGVDTDTTTVALNGLVRDDTWNWTPGAALYIDTATPGALTATQPSGTDDVIRVVGHAVTADVIYLNPSPDFITHT